MFSLSSALWRGFHYFTHHHPPSSLELAAGHVLIPSRFDWARSFPKPAVLAGLPVPVAHFYPFFHDLDSENHPAACFSEEIEGEKGGWAVGDDGAVVDWRILRNLFKKNNYKQFSRFCNFLNIFLISCLILSSERKIMKNISTYLMIKLYFI